jgi:hypothetical protein
MGNLASIAASKVEEARRLGSEHRADGQLRAAKSLIADLRKTIDAKEKQIATLEETIDLVCLMEDTRKKPEKIIVPKSRANEVVPIFIWSDWHVEEMVDRRKTLGKNEYNLQIAEARAKRCAESTVKMIRHSRLSSHVRSCLLVLGGDFITGDIHQELCETNLLGPAEACVFARELLASGLDAIRAEKYLQKIRVVCIVGNHGRTTKKMQYKNGAEKSFETIIYAELARQFADKRFEFTIARGGVEMIPLAPGFDVRAFHGHQVKYQGGIGGLTIPLTKWIHRQDQTQSAAWNLMGHWHQYGLPTPRCLCNGSTKGWDEYAAEHGFGFEPPQQAGAVYDASRSRIGGVFPIYCQ